MKKRGTRTITLRKKVHAEVALGSPVHREDFLPFPYVHYPNHYGSFISFSECVGSQDYFCECSRLSIMNFLRLFGLMDDGRFVESSSWKFKHDFSDRYTEAVKDPVRFEQLFHFREGICHRCNLQTPGMRWCVAMYGNNFVQYFGWYINQNRYRLGFDGNRYLEDGCPPHIAGKLKPFENIKFWELPPGSEITEEYSGVAKELARLVEDLSREEFGFRKIGESWINESILFDLVSLIYEGKEVQRRFRPAWLEGLELDVYIPDLKMAFEYQGQQHFFPIEAWGGEESFEELRKRDQKKSMLCRSLGVRLIEIAYNEPLTEEYIRAKVSGPIDQGL